jgi:hypothetical protein
MEPINENKIHDILTDIGNNLNQPQRVLMLSGAVMVHYGLKSTTKDIDYVARNTTVELHRITKKLKYDYIFNNDVDIYSFSYSRTDIQSVLTYNNLYVEIPTLLYMLCFQSYKEILHNDEKRAKDIFNILSKINIPIETIIKKFKYFFDEDLDTKNEEIIKEMIEDIKKQKPFNPMILW